MGLNPAVILSLETIDRQRDGQTTSETAKLTLGTTTWYTSVLDEQTQRQTDRLTLGAADSGADLQIPRPPI